MTQGAVMTVLRDALFTGLILSAPILLASVVVGLIISIIQAATQVNEQTISFVPKVIAVSLVLMALGPWMISTLADLMNRIMVDILTILK